MNWRIRIRTSTIFTVFTADREGGREGERKGGGGRESKRDRGREIKKVKKCSATGQEDVMVVTL